jgi:hypothetical protein
MLCRHRCARLLIGDGLGEFAQRSSRWSRRFDIGHGKAIRFAEPD